MHREKKKSITVLSLNTKGTWTARPDTDKILPVELYHTYSKVEKFFNKRVSLCVFMTTNRSWTSNGIRP